MLMASKEPAQRSDLRHGPACRPLRGSYLSMAFAQLTFRESLRDIEVCLRAHEAKLYHLGIRGHVARSNLGDANEKRDWHIYRDFANSLIAQARRLYADDAFAVDLDNTVYALHTTTIDLSLKVFPWAHFRKAKAAVKMHTQIDLRGNIPSFIHVSELPETRPSAISTILQATD